MKELVVISGKGGTGKTSISASLIICRAVSSPPTVMSMPPTSILSSGTKVRRTTAFQGGKKAVIDEALCTSCGHCAGAVPI